MIDIFNDGASIRLEENGVANPKYIHKVEIETISASVNRVFIEIRSGNVLNVLYTEVDIPSSTSAKDLAAQLNVFLETNPALVTTPALIDNKDYKLRDIAKILLRIEQQLSLITEENIQDTDKIVN